MNRLITLLLPLLTLAGLLWFFLYYLFCMIPRKGTLEWITRSDASGERRRFSFTAPLYPMQGKDALPLILLTAVYALSAFWNLGCTRAPQQFLQFQNGQSVTFSTQETVELSRIEYYTGLQEGSYTLEFSADGVNWTAVELEQTYAHLFYWLESELPEGGAPARYFSLTANCRDPIELGEVALFDQNGALITPITNDDSQALFDEQATVPAAPHWTNSAYFDEVYHARTAYEHLRGIEPYEISHPPLGKLIIALGIQLFGMTPFGWRFMGTLFGVLMVPLLYVFLKNLFGKTAVACCGAACFAFDFMHLTQTRIATIDTYGIFFILAMFYFLYRYLALPAGTPWRWCAPPLLLSGLMFGLGIASKWIVPYAGVGMAILYFIALFWKCRDWPQNRRAPRRWAWVVKTVLFSVLCFVIIPAAIYIASYLPYTKAAGVTDWRGLLELVWDNQVFMLTYHQGVNDAHPYSSRWYQWLLDIRPILYYMLNEEAAGFATRFASFNNPLVAWGGLLAFVSVAIQTFRRRCGKGLLILVGALTQFIPWVIIGRTTFAYHYFPTVLFLCLALAYVMNDLIESGRRWRPAVYTLTGVVAALYALFYPVLAGVRIPAQYMHTVLKWLPTWPF